MESHSERSMAGGAGGKAQARQKDLAGSGAIMVPSKSFPAYGLTLALYPR
jgi:hypothetical protein